MRSTVSLPWETIHVAADPAADDIELPTRRMQIAVYNRATPGVIGFGQTVDVFGVLAWLCNNQMIRALDAEIDAMVGDAPRHMNKASEPRPRCQRRGLPVSGEEEAQISLGGAGAPPTGHPAARTARRATGQATTRLVVRACRVSDGSLRNCGVPTFPFGHRGQDGARAARRVSLLPEEMGSWPTGSAGASLDGGCVRNQSFSASLGALGQ